MAFFSCAAPYFISFFSRESPVSYTHLNRIPAIAARIPEYIQVPHLVLRRLIPVSYTHLDVYKRQGLDRPGLPPKIHEQLLGILGIVAHRNL